MDRLIFYLVFLFFSFSACRNQTKVYIFFDRVDGIYEGSIAEARGIKIAKVVSMELKDSGVVIGLVMLNSNRIPKGSQFSIGYDNFLEGRNLIKVKYSDSKEYYKNNDTISVKFLRGLSDSNVKEINLDTNTKAAIMKVFGKLDTIITNVRQR